jgi:tetratricopeptide (TPR) repeat protein
MDGTYRPLFLSVLSLLGRLCGFEPGGLRLFSILLHSLNALLVFWIAVRIFRRSRRESQLVAFLFLLHPIQITGVALVWKQSDMWIALLALTSMLTIRSRPLVPLLLQLLALGVKESGMALPLLWLAVEPLASKEGRRTRLAVVLGGILISAAYYIVLWPRVPTGVPMPGNPASKLEYFLTQMRVIGLYGAALLDPYRLTIDRAIEASSAPGWAAGLVPALAFGLGAAWVFALRRGSGAITALLVGVAWLVPTSSFQTLTLFYDETRVYLAVACLGLLATILAERLPVARVLAPRWNRPLLGAACAVLMVLTLYQTDRWQSEEKLWRAALEVDPRSARAHYHVALALQEAGALEEAEAGYRKALEYATGLTEARLNLGIVIGQKGDLKEAEKQFSLLLGESSEWAARGHYHLGLAALYRGESARAGQHFHATLKLDPKSGLGAKGLAILLAREGRTAEALGRWREYQRTPNLSKKDREAVPRDLVPLIPPR